MVNKYGGCTKMINLPDKILGTDTRLIILWLEPISLGLVILLSMGLVIIPKITDIPQKMAMIKSVKAKTDDVNQKSRYLQTMNQEDIKNNALKLDMGLLPERSSYLLVGVVRKAAADAGYSVDDFSVSIPSVKLQTKTNSSGFDKLPASVTVVGPTANYISLVKSIERSLPIMLIDNIDMRTAQDGISIVKLNLSAYYLPEMGSPNFANLSLADLTPNQAELDLLSKISEYKTMTVEGVNTKTEFTKYERQDPFFIP